jgi:hypothetical protein
VIERLGRDIIAGIRLLESWPDLIGEGDEKVEVYKINGKTAVVVEGHEIFQGTYIWGLMSFRTGNYSYALWRVEGYAIWLNKLNPEKRTREISIFTKEPIRRDELSEFVKYLEEEYY